MRRNPESLGMSFKCPYHGLGRPFKPFPLVKAGPSDLQGRARPVFQKLPARSKAALEGPASRGRASERHWTSNTVRTVRTSANRSKLANSCSQMTNSLDNRPRSPRLTRGLWADVCARVSIHLSAMLEHNFAPPVSAINSHPLSAASGELEADAHVSHLRGGLSVNTPNPRAWLCARFIARLDSLSPSSGRRWLKCSQAGV